jgi:predicted phosphodiesterase
LLNDIEGRINISPDLAKIDFIIFSGDVAYAGKSDEYSAAKKELFDPLLKATGLSPDRLFIVPGNHDLDKDKFDLLPAALTRPLKSDAEIQNWLNDDVKRGRLLDPFEAFTRFVTKYTGQDRSDYGSVRKLVCV